jgi:hypothetical protein
MFNLTKIGQHFQLLGHKRWRAPFIGYSPRVANSAACALPSLSSCFVAACLLKISGTPAVHLQPLLFSSRGIATWLNSHFRPNTLLMNTSKIRATDVIRVVAETLDVICRARGIDVGDLDEATIETLLWSSFEEHLGDDVPPRRPERGTHADHRDL